METADRTAGGWFLPEMAARSKRQGKDAEISLRETDSLTLTRDCFFFLSTFTLNSLQCARPCTPGDCQGYRRPLTQLRSARLRPAARQSYREKHNPRPPVAHLSPTAPDSDSKHRQAGSQRVHWSERSLLITTAHSMRQIHICSGNSRVLADKLR